MKRITITREYAEAMRRFQSIKPFRADWVGGRRPTRGELHAIHSRRGRPARMRA